jgi:hypothetical protein
VLHGTLRCKRSYMVCGWSVVTNGSCSGGCVVSWSLLWDLHRSTGVPTRLAQVPCNMAWCFPCLNDARIDIGGLHSRCNQTISDTGLLHLLIPCGLLRAIIQFCSGGERSTCCIERPKFLTHFHSKNAETILIRRVRRCNAVGEDKR